MRGPVAFMVISAIFILMAGKGEHLRPGFAVLSLVFYSWGLLHFLLNGVLHAFY